MVNTGLLEEAISRSGLKKGYIAAQIGLTRAGLRNCITNRAEFKASQMLRLCDLLGLSNEQAKAIFSP